MPGPPPQRLFLVDGYALIYRAFFAMIARPLTTQRGENTSAAWGVTNFLLRLRQKYAPGYLAWVLDVGQSFRHREYPAYKATREKLGEELQQDFDRSLERIRELLAAFRVPVLGVEGFEADDVIGTLATAAASRGLQAVIVSGDKDFYQLIGPGVALLNPGRGGSAAVEETWVDERNAGERFGIAPGQVVDYLALVGDSSDNIPGVKGVGEKTALELLRTHGSLDGILTHAADWPGKRAREALLAHGEDAKLSRQLVTIRRDAPVTLDLDALRVAAADTAELERLFIELEFRSLIPKLTDLGPIPEPADAPAGGAEAAAAAPDRAALVLDDPAGLAAVIAACRAASLVAIEVHTAARELVGLALAVAQDRSWYLPFGHVAPEGPLAAGDEPRNLPALHGDTMRPLRELLTDASVPKAAHHIKNIWVSLRRLGVELSGARYDSQLAAFVLDPGRRSFTLEELARERLGRRLRTYAELVGQGRGRPERPFSAVPVADAARYCCDASECVLQLHTALAGELADHRLQPLLDDVEMPLVPVLTDMEWTGILVDRERLAALSREFAVELAAIERRVYAAAGTEFNLNSTPQLRSLLFVKLQLPVLKKTKTGPSTDVDVLEQLAEMGHEVPRLLMEYRELAKLKSTYVDALPSYIDPASGRIHTSYNQVGAATGRLSSVEPNLQNIPVRTERGESIRRAFIAAPGARLLVADYSQIELRLLAHFSGDPAFVQAFERGGDIHRQTAAVIFGVAQQAVTAVMRARAKTINFATIYGQGAFALARQLGITQEEARSFIQHYFERFAGVRAWLDRTIAEARHNGYVETLFGRRRYITELKDRNFNIRAFGERTATNSPLQGSAADLIKVAMIGLHGALRQARMATRLLLQVHDELVLESPEPEVPPAMELVKRHMEGAAKLRVPLVVSVGAGKNWVDAKS